MKDIEKLSGREICDIIKKCHENGVSRFSFNGLSIDFKFQEQEPNNHEVVPPPSVLVERPEEPLEERAKKQKDAFHELVEEARLADPTLYEELIQLEGTDGENET